MGLTPDLFIPRKNAQAHPGYSEDMRAIEIWAKGVQIPSGTPVDQVFISWGPNVDDSTGKLVYLGSTFGEFQYVVYSPPLASGYQIRFGAGWYGEFPADAVYAISSFPVIYGPNASVGGFTTYEVRNMELSVADATFANRFHALQKGSISVAPGGSHTMTAADFNTPLITGTQLSFGANGILNNAANAIYWCGIVGNWVFF